MSVTIRLSRIGRKNSPAFRVVATNTRSKRDGQVLDILGFYNPSQKPALFSIEEKKVKMWQERGAIISKAVDELIKGSYQFKPYTKHFKTGQAVEEEKKAEDKVEEKAE
jgi:small subunit ribosomal protein S16